MKGFKKGIALIAVLAFLITAILPVAAMAAPEVRITKDVPQGGSTEFVANGVSNLPSEVGTQYELVPQTGAQELPRAAYTVDITGTTLTITFNAGYLTQLGESTYDLWWVDPQYGYRLDCQASVTVNVTEATTATVVVPGTAAQGTTQAAQLVGTDETATWSVSPANQGVTIDPATGAITVAANAQPGTYTVTATLADGTTVTGTMEVTEAAAPTSYTVTAAPAENGTISVSAATAEAGATITVTATPNDGFTLATVTTEPATEVTVTGNTATFTMPAANVTVSATFAERGTLYDVDLSDELSEWLQPDMLEAAAGETVTLEASADQIQEGYGITDLKVVDANGNEIPVTYVSPTVYTFVMPAANVTVTAANGPVDPDAENQINAENGIEVDPNAKPGQTVTVKVPANADGTYPDTIYVIGADGTVYTAVNNGNGEFTFVMPAQAVTVTTEPKSDRPVSPTLGAATGDEYIEDYVATEGKPTVSNPFTYWTQPTAGLFMDSQGAYANRPTAGVPVEQNSGSMKEHFQIGPDNAEVCGGGTEALALNDRLQIYYNPRNIFAEPVRDANGTITGYRALDNCNWSEYVTMEWEYKPSTKDEDDGNPLKIPTGFGFSGVRSPMLTISPLTEAMDGWWVRLAIYPKTNAPNASDLYITTRWIRLDIDGVNGALDPVVTITSNPDAIGSITNVSRGGDAVLTAEVSNQPYGSTLSYQWQSLAQPTAANPTPEWASIAGATDQTLTLSNVTDALDGMSYRCQVTCRQSGPSDLGSVNTSNYLTLNVTDPDGSVYVTACNPDGSKLIYKFVGDTLQAQISAKTDNGDPVKYQWYVRSYLAPVPTSINTLPEAAAYLAGAASEEVTGATEAAMTSEPLKEGVYAFRCRVENANDPAKAVFGPIIYVIVSQDQIEIYPEPGDIISAGVVNGHSLTLEARAKAQNVTYQWQRYNTASQQWTTLTATGPNLTLPALTTEATGTLYRCAISTPGSTNPVYTGWYLINVWDTANTPVVTQTSQNIHWSLSQFEHDLDVNIQKNTDAATGIVSGTMDLLTSSATVAQDLEHGIGPVWAVWYNKAGKVIAAEPYGTSKDEMRPITNWAANANLYRSSIESPSKGSYKSTLQLNLGAVFNDANECASTETIARALNGTYYCVWYKPQTTQEVLEKTMYVYDYEHLGHDQSYTPVDMTNDMWLLAPQATRGTTAIRIEVPGDPWIITDLAGTATVSVGSRATLSVAAAITQPSDTNTPVYTWQVSEDGGSTWRNCLSTDGTGQFTSAFTTRTITQDDYDTNTTLSYRVIVASRPNVAKIVSNVCALRITAGTPQAPAITPGEGSPIKVENGVATGVTVSKTGTTVSSFLSQLNMMVPAGYSLRIVGSDDQPLASDAIVYTGCKVQLVADATQDVAAEATIIVAGDVLGTGIVAINQVVRMAQDLNGTRALEGIYQQAGDFNGSGSIDIADLVREAQILAEPVDVQ